MAYTLYTIIQQDPDKTYYDRKQGLTQEEYFQKIKTSTTLYVGNLSFYTREDQLLNYFSLCSQILPRLIMGLNNQTKTPCGFCFVEYATKQEASLARALLDHSNIDGRIVRVDWDVGFEWGRQYGRGKNGYQIRDELRPEDVKDHERPKNMHNRERRPYINRNGEQDKDNEGENGDAFRRRGGRGDFRGERGRFRGGDRGGRGGFRGGRGRGGYRDNNDDDNNDSSCKANNDAFDQWNNIDTANQNDTDKKDDPWAKTEDNWANTDQKIETKNETMTDSGWGSDKENKNDNSKNKQWGDDDNKVKSSDDWGGKSESNNNNNNNDRPFQSRYDRQNSNNRNDDYRQNDREDSGGYRGSRGNYRGDRGNYRGGRGEYSRGRGDYRGGRGGYRGSSNDYNRNSDYSNSNYQGDRKRFKSDQDNNNTTSDDWDKPTNQANINANSPIQGDKKSTKTPNKDIDQWGDTSEIKVGTKRKREVNNDEDGWGDDNKKESKDESNNGWGDDSKSKDELVNKQNDVNNNDGGWGDVPSKVNVKNELADDTEW
eukprot:403340450